MDASARVQQLLLLVQVGRIGAANTCSDSLQGQFAPCSTGITPRLSSGPVHINLPSITAVSSISADPASITCQGDAAALDPVAVPQTCALQVIVALSDGSQQVLMDDRAAFTLAARSAPECKLAHDASAGTVSVTADGTGTCADAVCTVSVTYPGLNTTLSAEVQIALVALQQLQVFAQAYNESATCSADTLAAQRQAATLNPIACSNDFEQVSLCAAAQLSAAPGQLEGQRVDVTAAANFTSGAAAVTLLPNLLDPTVTNRVRPVAAASAGVTAQFGNVASDPVAITATSDEQRLQSIQLEWAAAPAVGPECGLPCKQTFSGLANASEPLALGVTLTDGFTYDAATLLGADAMKGDILDVASLLTFTSDDSQAVSVTQVGDAQLLGNAASAVTISASTECTHSGSPMSSEVQVFANLQPAAMDADVGQLYGPAVRASADATDVPGFPQVRLLRQIPLSESGLHFSPNCLLSIIPI